MEQDRTTFKPSGQLIHSYVRLSPLAAANGKGKAAANTQQTLDSEDANAVVYEVYHVSPGIILQPLYPLISIYPPFAASTFSGFPCTLHYVMARRHGIPLGLENIIAKCSCSFYYTSRVGHTSTRKKILGNLLYCKSICSGFINTLEGDSCCSYEKRKRQSTPGTSTYHFVGYSSLYPFFHFPESVRLRLR